MKKKLLTTLLLSSLVLSSVTIANQSFAEETSTTALSTEQVTTAVPKDEVKPLIVKYVDETGSSIAIEDQFTGDLDTAFDITPKDIKNYTYKSTDKALTGNYTAEEQTITLTYSKTESPITVSEINVSYVDLNGKEIAKTETLSGTIGESYSFKPKDINGYTYSKVLSGSLTGKYTEDAQKVLIEYKENAKTSKVTINYVDEKNNEIKKPITHEGVVGQKAPIVKEEISGYQFSSGTLDISYTEEAQAITHTYKKIGQGPYITDGSYVKITKNNYSLYSNFNWTKKNSSNNLYGQTLLARGRYEHTNGFTYYSLFDAKGVWQGYLNAEATTKTTPQGPYITDGQIVKVTKQGYDSWSNFSWDTKNTNNQLLGKTFKARGRYEHFNGNTYYSLYDAKGVWYGYMNANAVVAGEESGDYISDGRYVKVNKKGYNVFSNFSWKKKTTSDALYGQTLQARGRYDHFNGSTYYSLYNVKGEWQGYLNADATTAAKPEGNYIADGRFVKIEKMGYDIFSNFDWKVKNSSNNLRGNIFTAQGRYEHINGNTYYSLYDANNKWQGYIDAKATSTVTNPQGNYIADGRYVKVNKSGYSVWSNFDWKFRNKSDELLGATLHARGRYEHANGSTYFSLFDLNGVWQGYLNAEATTDAKAQGNYIPDGDYVKITKKGVNVYSDFSWSIKGTTDTMIDKYYQARGRYEHANGKTYFSLYDNKGIWQGYVESSAAIKITSPQGPYISDGSYFNVTNANFDIWGSFKENKIGSTEKLFGKTYHARGHYKHVNGYTYYSLYDNKGVWQGYVDSRAGKVTTEQGPYIKDGRYGTVTKKGYNIYSNFDWKVVTTSDKLLGKTYQLRGRYEHFNGSTYYSLFENDKWIGYINSDAVTLN